MKNGECPSDELIAAVDTAVKNSAKKSLNDYITVNKPETVDYAINIKYYINESDRSKAAEIPTSSGSQKRLGETFPHGN